MTAIKFPATAWNNGKWHASGAGYGLKVSVADRDRFFQRDWRTVTLRLVADSGFVDVEVNCANQLSRRIRDGTLSDIEGRFLDGQFLRSLEYDNLGETITSSLGKAEMSIFRLAPP